MLHYTSKAKFRRKCYFQYFGAFHQHFDEIPLHTTIITPTIGFMRGDTKRKRMGLGLYRDAFSENIHHPHPRREMQIQSRD